MLIVSTPIDFEFEALVVTCAISLLESLISKRFTNSSTEIETKLLEMDKIPYHKKLIYKYRLDQKLLIKLNSKIFLIITHL